MYEGLLPGQHLHRLRSLAGSCSGSSSRWACFLLLPAGGWVLLDGSRATHVGAWADVQAACAAFRIQPAVLLYEAGQQ